MSPEIGLTPDAAPTLADLAAFLDRLLGADRFRDGEDPAGVYRASERPVETVGLLLDPWDGLPGWIAAEGIDALVVHRPWRLPLAELGDVGVLAYHLAFDERLTLGDNPDLAAAIGMTDVEVLGCKAGRPLGMLGTIPEQPAADVLERLERLFGGLEAIVEGANPGVSRVAVVGAMTDALVREAAEKGADLYVTGQLRVPARVAVVETGLGAIAVGHARSERWGLRVLRDALRERWPGLRVVLAPEAPHGRGRQPAV